jgi:hypothetical protein
LVADAVMLLPFDVTSTPFCITMLPPDPVAFSVILPAVFTLFAGTEPTTGAPASRTPAVTLEPVSS